MKNIAVIDLINSFQIYSDDDTWNQFARLTQIYVDLADYTRNAVSLNTDQRIPVMRPIFMDFEYDNAAYDIVSIQYCYIYTIELIL